MEDFLYNLDGTKSLLNRVPNLFCLAIYQTTECLVIVNAYRARGQLKENGFSEDNTRQYILQTKKDTTIAQLRDGLSFDAVEYITSGYKSQGYLCFPSNHISVEFCSDMHDKELSDFMRKHELHSAKKASFLAEKESIYSFVVPRADGAKTIIVAQKIYEEGQALFAEPEFFSEFRRE